MPTLRARFLTLLLASQVAVLNPSALAQEAKPVPSAPELGPKNVPSDILRCERNYEYDKKIYPCDSPVDFDGEGLRALLESVPESRRELDLYQANRRSLDVTGFMGMAGILIASFAPRFFASPQEKNIAIGAGVSITLASFAFGRSRLNTNEGHLQRAVSLYNSAHPENPIQMLQATSQENPQKP